MPENRWLVPLSDIDVGEELASAVADVISSGWWSMGPRVADFEREFAGLCATEHAFAVANGTAALHLALLAAGCGPGDEVILPSLNFVAAANSVTHVGATPVFCDIKGSHDLNLDPADVEAAIGERTKAVIALHYGGYACDLEELTEIVSRHGLALIEDAAHAPGATWQGKPCGSVGLAGCFSFFSNKNLPVGEGGMVVTSDAEVARQVRLLRSHGMTTLTWDRHRGHAHSYDVVVSGYNYRLDEVRAAMGLVHLRQLAADNRRRGEVSAAYRAAFEKTGISMPFASAEAQATSAHHLAVAVLPDGVPRDEVRTRLERARIQTSVHYPPIHRFSAYAGRAGSRPLPRTEAVAGRLVTLPLFPHMTESQHRAVVEALVEAVSELG